MVVDGGGERELFGNGDEAKTLEASQEHGKGSELR